MAKIAFRQAPRVFAFFDGMHGDGVGDCFNEARTIASDEDAEAAGIQVQRREVKYHQQVASQSDPTLATFLLPDSTEPLNQLGCKLLLTQISSSFHDDRQDLIKSRPNVSRLWR
jgi:hypothetical protein